MKSILFLATMLCAKNTAPEDGGAGAAAPAKAAKKGAKEKPAKEVPVKIERPVANGVTRPAAGTLTGRVWEAADTISAKKKEPATIAEVREHLGETVNPSTITTQFGQWRRFYGIVGRTPAAPKEAKPKKGKASVASSVPDGGIAKTVNEDGSTEPA